MRYLLVIPAAILDFLQAAFLIIFIVLQFMTPIGAGATGALAAGYYCWSTASGILTGIRDAFICSTGGGLVGAGVSAFATPIGVAVDVALSLTLGAAIVVMLAWQGMFYPSIIMKGFVAELMPFFNFLPMWTTMVLKCIWEKNAQEAMPHSSTAGKALGAVAGLAALAIPGGGVAKTMTGRAIHQFSAASAVVEGASQKSARTPLVNRFSDITPRKAANDNSSQPYAQAA